MVCPDNIQHMKIDRCVSANWRILCVVAKFDDARAYGLCCDYVLAVNQSNKTNPDDRLPAVNVIKTNPSVLIEIKAFNQVAIWILKLILNPSKCHTYIYSSLIIISIPGAKLSKNNCQGKLWCYCQLLGKSRDAWRDYTDHVVSFFFFFCKSNWILCFANLQEMNRPSLKLFHKSLDSSRSLIWTVSVLFLVCWPWILQHCFYSLLNGIVFSLSLNGSNSHIAWLLSVLGPRSWSAFEDMR